MVLVGIIIGVGEVVVLVLWLFIGWFLDWIGWYWVISIVGYVITFVSVSLLVVVGLLWLVCCFVIGERLGKVVRILVWDIMFVEVGADLGYGWVFVMHEVVD